MAAPKVLDIAASHGAPGITIAQHNPTAQIYALDWSNVLQVAQENGRQAGLGDRYHVSSKRTRGGDRAGL